jgi:hypothetical protein
LFLRLGELHCPQDSTVAHPARPSSNQEAIMGHNVGGVDRIGRIVIGIVLLIVALTAPMTMVWRGVLLIVAAIALVTAAVRFCPVNAMLGIDTCKGEDKK